MLNKKLGKIVLTAGMTAVLVFSATACGSGGGSSAGSKASSAASGAAPKSAASSSAAAQTTAASSTAASSTAPSGSSASKSAELNEKELDSLAQQIAADQLKKNYAKFVKEENDQLFGVVEVFGIDRKDTLGTLYARAGIGEYVSFKGDAFLMSGISAEGIFTFEYTDQGPKLQGVKWSADAAAHEKWMKDNFPEKYYKAWQDYKPEDANGNNKLNSALDAKASKALGVPKAETLLEINEDGSYEVTKVIESGTGSDYKFDTEVIDKGKL